MGFFLNIILRPNETYSYVHSHGTFFSDEVLWLSKNYSNYCNFRQFWAASDLWINAESPSEDEILKHATVFTQWSLGVKCLKRDTFGRQSSVLYNVNRRLRPEVSFQSICPITFYSVHYYNISIKAHG